ALAGPHPRSAPRSVSLDCPLLPGSDRPAEESSMNERFVALKNRWAEIFDLGMSASVLRWDQTTYMPPGGAPARGRQLALLARLAHERLTDPEVGRLIDALEREVPPGDTDEAAFVRLARRELYGAVNVAC